jgi:hypothetical protein
MTGSVARYSGTGGLPGVCFVRDERVRNAKFESQIETILERDLRLIYETTLPYTTLRRVMVELAANIGEPLNLTSIQRKTRVSVNTLKKLLSAFGAMFLVELLQSSEDASQPTIYFSDSGEASYLAAGRLSPVQTLSQALFSNVTATCSALWSSKVGPYRMTCHRTRGGTNIPLVINTGKGALGILPWPVGMSFGSVLAQTKSFMSLDKAQGVIVVSQDGKNVKRHLDHLIEMPHHVLVS